MISKNVKIFLSYAHGDAVVVDAVDQWLRDRGYQVLRDERDFSPGNFITDEIERCIQAADRVFVIYSRNSTDRDYPKLERRIAHEFVRQGKKEPFLVYFRIDDSPLRISEADRLAVNAFKMSGSGAFENACLELERSITGEPAKPQFVDYKTLYADQAPWESEGEIGLLQSLVTQLRDEGESFAGRLTKLQQIAALRSPAAIKTLETIEIDSFFAEGEREAARILLSDIEDGKRSLNVAQRVDEARKRRRGYSVGEEAMQKASPGAAALDALMSVMWSYRPHEEVWEQSAKAIIDVAMKPPKESPEAS